MDRLTAPATCILQKTDKGRAEIETSARTLRGPLRTALILANGRDSVASLCSRLGPAAATLLETLRKGGYVEERAPAPSAWPAIPPVLPALPPPLSVAARRRLRSLQRQALAILAPHFGPDAPVIASALLRAATMDEFARMLEPIEKKLAIYVGRSHAARMLARLREGLNAAD